MNEHSNPQNYFHEWTLIVGWLLNGFCIWLNQIAAWPEHFTWHSVQWTRQRKGDIFHNLKRLAPVINQLPTWVPTRDSWPHRSVSCSTACYCINRLFSTQKSACMYFSRGNHFHQKNMVFGYTGFLNTPVQLQWYGLFLYRSIFVWCDLELPDQVGCESVCRACVYRIRIWPQIVSMWVWWTQARGKRQRLSVPSQVSQSGFPPTHYSPRGSREHPRWHHTPGVVSLQTQQQDQ